MIRRLSEDVQAKLRSGIAIFSLTQCVEELLLNSIDAGASCVAVRVDIEAGKVQVLDNGSGMDRQDLEQVGNRYFTSKCGSLDDLEALRFYGFRGEALASIAGLATLLEVSSRTPESVKTFVKVFKNGRGLDVSEAATTRPAAGTTVVACDVFHNLPVRRKRLDPVLECERIRQRIEAVSLMHPSVSFSLRNDSTGCTVLQLSKSRATYYRFTQIHGLGRAQKLGEISHCHNQFEMSGHIGREGHYNNSMQFLYVNSRLVLRTRIHKLLNFLLKKVRVASRQNSIPVVSIAVHSPKQRGGSELHGVYVINIKCHYSEYDVCMEPAKTLIEFRDWDGVLLCVEEGVKKFLVKENLVAEVSPEDMSEFVHENTFNDPSAWADSTEGGPGAGSLKPASSCTRDPGEGKTLQSKDVHRALAVDFNLTGSVWQAGDEDDTAGQGETEIRNPESTCPPESEKTLASPDSHKVTSSSSESKEIKITEMLGSASVTPNTPTEARRDDESLTDVSDRDLKEECSGVAQLGLSVSLCSNSKRAKLSVNTKTAKEPENHCLNLIDNRKEPEKNTESVISRDVPPEMPPKFQEETPFDRSSLGHKTERANDSRSVQFQLGSTGFIRHVIPKLRANENESEVQEGLRRFCRQGPSSDQDILREKQCNSTQHKYSFLGKEASQTTANEPCKSLQQPDIYHEHTIATFTVKVNSSEAPKRKISLPESTDTSESSCEGPEFSIGSASEISNMTARPKLSLPADTGSLDRFRRIYGKQHPIEKDFRAQDANNNQNSPDAITSRMKICGTANVEKLFPCSTDGCGANGTHRISLMQLNDSPISLLEFTKMKPVLAHSKRTLATKLSRLRNQQKEDKGKVLQEQLMEGADTSRISDFGLDTESQKSGSEVKQPSHFHIPSPDDINPNTETTEVRKCKETLSCPGDTTVELNPLKKVTLVTSKESCSSVTINGDTLCEGGRPDKAVTGHSENQPSCEAVDSPGKEVSRDAYRFAADTSPGRMQENESPGLAAGSSDWVEHFDECVGKMVYINPVTGLSKYEAPPAEAPQALCTTDITTMAVNVVSSKDDPSAAESVWSLFSEWENPVFVRKPEVGLDVSCGQAEGLAVKIHSILYPYRFTKEMIHSMKIVQQVDKKFLACLINTKDKGDGGSTDSAVEGNLLVLVDQHAAHERIRLENLVTDSYEVHPEAPGQRRLCSSRVCPPLEIDVTEEELRLLRSCQPFLRDLGLEVTFVETGAPRILVGKVPVCFLEREANELRRGRQTVTRAIVEEYIREQIELVRSTGRVRGTLPLTVLKVLASQACHGAIKFNDSLSKEECCSLVESLSTCQLPFQCAHGRPSMLPLADLDHLDTEIREPPKPNLLKLRKMYRAWKLFGKQ
ncbi:DNA mismatch repair protein Mlh3 isoform X2 [Lepisosteus oculatus]|uniref:DNA mismatch repair protein Mlh3 isoform X2 n=1 Tax=Lepisosteus oculatus TaxID=7918 RepID=UPI0037212D3F